MSDPKGDNSGRVPAGEGTQQVARSILERRGGLLLGCVVAVALTILVVAYFRPLYQTEPDAGSVPAVKDPALDQTLPANANSASMQPTKASPPDLPAQSPVPRPPTVDLASVAVPATVEQLQQETEQVANDLRQRYPNQAAALHVVAMMHAQFRQTAQAEKLWQKCIELAPNDERYYVNLAAIAMDRGNSELAAETLQKAVDAGSTSPDVLHHLGVALTNLGRCDEAEAVIQPALVLYPKSPAHWQVLGQAQLKLGKAADAEASLRKALALGSQSADVYFALGNACARQGKREEAAEYRQRFTELTAAQPLEAQQRFQILSTAEARRTAVAIMTEAAAVHSWQGDSLEAERLLLRAIALDPASSESCRALAALYADAAMMPEERVVRRRLVEIEPQNFDNYINLAQVSAQLGEPEGAEAALKLAISMRPTAAVPYATLAQFYLQSGKTSKARWFAQEAVRREPTAAGYDLLAATCRAMGDEASTKAAQAMASKLAPNTSKPEQKGP